MQNDKLLPCPFCGGEAKVEWEAWKDISDTSGIYRLTVKHSDGCYFEEMIGLSNKGQMVDTNKERIVKAWNTRKPMELIVKQLETLRIDNHNYFGVLNIVAEKYDRANEMLDDAIEIVKGGVDNAG